MKRSAMDVPLVWTKQELALTPAELLNKANDSHLSNTVRGDAYRKSEAMKWYEFVVLAPIVHVDVNMLTLQEGRDVLQLRTLIGTTPPWRERRLEWETI